MRHLVVWYGWRLGVIIVYSEFRTLLIWHLYMGLMLDPWWSSSAAGPPLPPSSPWPSYACRHTYSVSVHAPSPWPLWVSYPGPRRCGSWESHSASSQLLMRSVTVGHQKAVYLPPRVLLLCYGRVRHLHGVQVTFTACTGPSWTLAFLYIPSTTLFHASGKLPDALDDAIEWDSGLNLRAIWSWNKQYIGGNVNCV